MQASVRSQGHTQTPGLAGRRAVVTGATGALGRAVVAALATAGARVAALARRPAAPPSGALALVDAELSDERAVSAAFERVVAALGGHVDILVHAAGGYDEAPLPRMPLALWRRMLDDNVTSAFLCARAVLDPMCRAGWGRIVTVGSRHALRGDRGLAAYAASKGALLRLTETVAAEGLAHGVTANCLLPGTIDTAANRAAMPRADHSAWVPPEAIAAVCLFLCSEHGGVVSGAAIPVYGRS